MTDAPVALHPAEPVALLTFEVWSDAAGFAERFAKAFGAPPPAAGHAADLGAVRVLWLEPGAWMAVTQPAQADAVAAQLATALGEAGAVTELTGGLARIEIQGPAWRELLTIGAVFDVEYPGFGVGRVAGTVIHHAPVRLDVTAPDRVMAYTLPSYAEALFESWAGAAKRIAAAA